MDIKNQFLRLAGMDYNVRPSAQFKQEQQIQEPAPVAAADAASVQTLSEAVGKLAEVVEKLQAAQKPVTEVVEPDASLVYRVSGASQPAHGYWSQVRRVAGYGLKNKETGDFMDVPYGIAFESRKEAKDYLKQTAPKGERGNWKVVDWALECVAFGSSVEGFIVKHKDSGDVKGPRHMTQQSAEEYIKLKIPAEDRKDFKVDTVQLTKESVGVAGFVIVNAKTDAIKSGPYDTKDEAEEYIRRHTPTDGEENDKWKVLPHDQLGYTPKPNGKGVSESVVLDEGKTKKPAKAAGAKTLNDILKTKKGGGHRSDKDFDRNKDKEKVRKELTSEAMGMVDLKAAKEELRKKGYVQSHSAASDEGEGGVYFRHPETKKYAAIRKGKIHYDVDESVVIGENQPFLLQKEKVVNLSGEAGVKAGDNSSKAGGPEYRKPQYRHPDYEHNEISDEHDKLGGEEEEGVDVPQQYGLVKIPSDVLDSVRDEIKHCREMAEKTPDDVINTKGHGDKSWWKNTADQLQRVLDLLETGEESNLKRATVIMQSWENARWWNWPSALLKFMSHYGYGYKYPSLIDKFKEVKHNLIPLK